MCSDKREHNIGSGKDSDTKTKIHPLGQNLVFVSLGFTRATVTKRDGKERKVFELDASINSYFSKHGYAVYQSTWTQLKTALDKSLASASGKEYAAQALE